MLARIALFALMIAGLVGFGGVAWISLNPAPPPSQTDPATQTTLAILVAARPLRAGSLVKPEDLAAAPQLRKDVPAGAWIDSPSTRAALLGAMIRRNMAAGETLLPPDALNPGERGFLASVLRPGMRAVTVGVDAISGLSGLVWPGDRVDLILTQSQNRSDIPPSRRVSGETVLGNVRVIAIDRHLIQGATSESPQTQTERTVTLEVTPADAERVVVAARLGNLSLAVLAAAAPAASTPVASTPAASMPAGSTPTASMPAASMPAASMPAASMPAASTPAASTPADGKPLRAPASPEPVGSVTWGGDVSSALRGGSQSDGGTVRLFQGPSDSKEIHF
jgi:pilus assembly protein CpaB